ncbi:hypothetical protein P153DRAFT_371116 [Dothidotthia symphoricarpi CBS 119687]|uniref:DUF6590 domain-containing protein n=1 Tax=Dothidotthia symphoricarpi CBS 119687 TaxID=1392245 RepID=A0A6A5ZZ04_9PLEO|nr:uncharacterized protein P153DRAFT_371116 [Dothidotthia symphoricarpi CBS 119687]KAF2124255.1 hypothetical protein P153DRAFT_371116 [Dothidotthia symphoricarpi CBS 119687]
MFFGFSVGDFLAGAQLAYTLHQVLSDAKHSPEELQELNTQLDVVYKVLLQVDQLQTTNQLSPATINALLFTVNSGIETMESFLDQNQLYLDMLKSDGPGFSTADAWWKLEWPVQMPTRVKRLKKSLATMLASVNCLVSLACYHNTSYDPGCEVQLELHNLGGTTYWGKYHGGHVKIASKLHGQFGTHNFLDFVRQHDCASFFRAGQVFDARIVSSFYVDADRRFTEIDIGHLPLETVSKLKAMDEEIHIADHTKRLAQIRALPLSQMTVYCKDLRFDRTRVRCLLCKSRPYLKDDWTFHFQLDHWQYYFAMLPEPLITSHPYTEEELVPRSELVQPSPYSSFSADNWIILEDITTHVPIYTDEGIVRLIHNYSEEGYNMKGPVMVQRFVVISRGDSSCLCLGIHTHAQQGCGRQPDQELFGIVHSSKDPPAPFPDEIGLRLSPMRMQPHHPSTTLPKSARIHFGRAYDVDYDAPVQPIGLIDPMSMESLLDQFDANVYRCDTDHEQASEQSPWTESLYGVNGRSCGLGDEAKLVDLDIVREMRSNITKVLGNKLSPADHQPVQFGGNDE